jgi:inactivated superfamily I helicase
MNKDFKNELQCGEFEAILADALDQDRASEVAEAGNSILSEEAMEAFEAHGRSCQVCGPLLADARQGMLLLRSIEEIEPPRNLLHNILAATTMAEAGVTATAGETSQGWLDRVRRTLRPSLAGLMRSRFATSFAMAFFSLSLTLSLAGVKVSDVSRIDWHPSALRRNVVLGYTDIEARVARYYDNLRVVYEVESRVRELKKNVTPRQNNDNNNKPEQQNENKPAPDTSGRPVQHDTYSMDRDGSLIAKSTMKYEGAQI